MLTVIAIANAVLWSGVIIALLFGLMNRERTLETRLVQLESKLVDDSQQR